MTPTLDYAYSPSGTASLFWMKFYSHRKPQLSLNEWEVIYLNNIVLSIINRTYFNCSNYILTKNHWYLTQSQCTCTYPIYSWESRMSTSYGSTGGWIHHISGPNFWIVWCLRGLLLANTGSCQHGTIFEYFIFIAGISYSDKHNINCIITQLDTLLDD